MFKNKNKIEKTLVFRQKDQVFVLFPLSALTRFWFKATYIIYMGGGSTFIIFLGLKKNCNF